MFFSLSGTPSLLLSTPCCRGQGPPLAVAACILSTTRAGGITGKTPRRAACLKVWWTRGACRRDMAGAGLPPGPRREMEHRARRVPPGRGPAQCPCIWHNAHIIHAKIVHPGNVWRTSFVTSFLGTRYLLSGFQPALISSGVGCASPISQPAFPSGREAGKVHEVHYIAPS